MMRSLSTTALSVLYVSAHFTMAVPAHGGHVCAPDPGYDVEKVLAQALRVSTHSWEYGTAAEALLELYNPELSVFGKDPFPGGKIPKADVEKTRSLAYAKKFINVTGDILIDGDGLP